MFYYLLSKDDFASLYKYGEVKVKHGAASESDDARAAVKQLFDASDSFEFAQERVILACEKGTPDIVRMVDVCSIYPLDDISKNLLEQDFNSALFFCQPIFQDLAEDFLKNAVLERNTISGINALRSIFGFGEEEDSELIKEIIRGKQFLRKYGKYYDVPLEERSPYSMLIAYNRYQHYPKDDRGFFYDAADCFMYGYMYTVLLKDKNYSLIGYLPDVLNSTSNSYVSLLESIPKGSKFKDVAETVNSAKHKISEAITPVYGSLRFLALYFCIKERILTDDTITLEGLRFIFGAQKKYPEDFPKLLTLVGGFLGYTWVYERFYEFRNVPFLTIHHTLDDLEKKAIEIVLPPVSETVQTDNQSASGNSPEEPVVLDNTPTPADIQTEQIDDLPDGDLPIAQPAEGTIATPSDSEPIHAETLHIPEQDLEDLDLDIPGIVKLLFPRASQRRSKFEFRLQENHDIVLKLAKARDEDGLRGVYFKLDTDFKPKTEQERLNNFVHSAMELKQKMFND